MQDYLGLCRDPLSDLQRWLEEDKKKPSQLRTTQPASHARHATTIASAQRFLRDALHEMSGRVRAHDIAGHNGRALSRGSRAGASEPGQLQQVQSERNLTDHTRSNVQGHDTDGGELSGIHGYYAALIAAARATMRPGQAAAAIRDLRNQKTLAIRFAKDRKHAERANRPKPHRPSAAAPPTILPKWQYR